MIAVPAGILLPTSILSSPGFTLLATVVAFNTLIYVGLTLAKLIPLPRQFHPSRVRRWLGRTDTAVEQDSPMAAIPIPVVPESENPYEEMRRGIAKRDIPQAFALTGGLLVVLAVTSLFAFPKAGPAQHVTQFVTALAFLVAAQVLGRRRFRAVTLMWTWAASSLVLVTLLLVATILTDDLVVLAYVVIIMTAFAPVGLSWRPSLMAGSIMLVGMVTVSLNLDGQRAAPWILAAVGALLAGATLLRLRLVAIDALSDEESRSRALATTDPLTGSLTRQGLLTLVPGLASTATRAGQEVCVMMFDVNRLSTANDQYGMAYGDDVLRAVGHAIASTVRQGDLVARWGGDEFLVVGLGSRPSAEHLALRIQEAVRMSGVNLGKWPTTVRVGTSSGDPQVTTLDSLLAEAEEHMRNAPSGSSFAGSAA